MECDVVHSGICMYPDIFSCNRMLMMETVGSYERSAQIFPSTLCRRPTTEHSPELASRLLVGPNIW